MSARATRSPIYFDYIVKPGDSLARIITTMYGQTSTTPGYRKSLEFLLSLNPQINDPNLIYPGRIVHLGIVPDSKPANAFARDSASPYATRTPPHSHSLPTQITSNDAQYLWALSWLEHNSNSIVIPGSVATGAASNLMSPGNAQLVATVSDLYADYKKGLLTKAQYD